MGLEHRVKTEEGAEKATNRLREILGNLEQFLAINSEPDAHEFWSVITDAQAFDVSKPSLQKHPIAPKAPKPPRRPPRLRKPPKPNLVLPFKPKMRSREEILNKIKFDLRHTKTVYMGMWERILEIVGSPKAKSMRQGNFDSLEVLVRHELAQDKEQHRNWETECEKRRDNYDLEIQEWEKSVSEIDEEYLSMCLEWEEEKARQSESFAEAMDIWRKQCDELKEEDKERIKSWQAKKNKHQRNTSLAIKKVLKAHREGDKSLVEKNCCRILKHITCPIKCRNKVTVDYIPETRTLVADISLPALESMPESKEVRYLKTKGTCKVIPLSATQRRSIYDDFIYQYILAQTNRLFVIDQGMAIDAVAMNGWVDIINSATGKTVNVCILSLHVKRDEMKAVNLKKVKARDCFRHLKGIGSPKPHATVAVAPIMDISRKDSRFVKARAMAGKIDESVNLAAMDWDDFEHLIREIFESEFKSTGGEVKITQASRDRGVDAIAFDPDPIRGGKIVIQAKRYTNVVGVAAVRDLYGTVMNEGATKGILVTTSNYGPDAFEFARDKPITLLSGNHLLHLLEKHGRKARIDLREAKRILAEAEKTK